MKKIVVILDGMGGGAGAQVVERLAKACPDIQLIALGTNALATQRMMEAGAHRGASGENAIRVSIGLGDIIVAPLGMAIPHSLLGEVSPAMAEALALARGKKFLLPLHQSHFVLPGLKDPGMAEILEETVRLVREAVQTED